MYCTFTYETYGSIYLHLMLDEANVNGQAMSAEREYKILEYIWKGIRWTWWGIASVMVWPSILAQMDVMEEI